MDRTVDFKKLVYEMRKAQKQYFKSRDRKDLTESKGTGKRGGDFLKRHYQEQAGTRTLFD